MSANTADRPQVLNARDIEQYVMEVASKYFDFAVATVESKYGEDAHNDAPAVLTSLVQACAVIHVSEALSYDLDGLGLRLLDVACAIETHGE